MQASFTILRAGEVDLNPRRPPWQKGGGLERTRAPTEILDGSGVAGGRPEAAEDDAVRAVKRGETACLPGLGHPHEHPRPDVALAPCRGLGQHAPGHAPPHARRRVVSQAVRGTAPGAVSAPPATVPRERPRRGWRSG